MNLRQLHYLQLIISEGSFGAAARAANISQPAVSQAMRALEKLLGQPLFEQHGRRKIPTRTALLLAQQAEELEAAVAPLITTRISHAPYNTPNARKTLRVGISSGAGLVYGPLITKTWQELVPNEPVNMTSGSSPNMLNALERGELDLVIAPRPRGHHHSALNHKVLFTSSPVIYARQGHPLASASSLEELNGVGWVIVGREGAAINMIEEAHRVRRLEPPKILAQCPDHTTLLHLIAESDLMGIIPINLIASSVLQTKIQPLCIRESLPHYDVCIFKRSVSKPAQTPEVNKLFEIMKNAALAGPHSKD